MKRILQLMPSALLRKMQGSSKRSKDAVKNIAVSLCSKGISILVSFLMVPMTINYVNPTQYGVWLTLSSVIGWISFMNLGLGNGFRNRFAESKAKGDIHTARVYLSTTYFAITCLVIVLFAVAMIANAFINWADFLHLDSSYTEELNKVFVILCIFFCFNMVVKIFDSLLLADQKPGLSSIVQVLGQVFSLLAIFILTKCTEGSLTNLALFYASIPGVVMLLASIIAFCFTRYRRYAPSLKLIQPKYIKNILNLGIQFFLIYICLILIFQIINLVITREIGPEMATTYNVAYKYFNTIYMVMLIIITPFWSAFTDAYTQKDISWMKSVLKKLEKLWLLSIVGGGLMLALSPWFYRIWVGESVAVPFLLSVAVLAYSLVQVIGCIYMNLINGIGTIRLQLIIYIIFAAISWPVLTYFCRTLGVYGVVIFPTFVYAIQAFIGKIQLNKLLNGKASGVWTK